MAVMWGTARSSQRPLQEIVHDALDALVGPVRAGPMRPRELVAGRRREPLGPKDGRGIEDEILPGAGEDRGGVTRGIHAAGPDEPLGDDFIARNARRRPVMFPSYQAGNAVALFHPGAFEDPVTGQRAGPVAAAIEGHHAPRADDETLVGTNALVFLGEDFFLLRHFRIGQTGKMADAFDDALLAAVARR